jgi:hypothetical protein
MYLMQVREKARAEIAREMQKVADRVTAGSARDYAEYRQMVGRIQGMKDGLTVVDEVFNKLLDEGDAE